MCAGCDDEILIDNGIVSSSNFLEAATRPKRLHWRMRNLDSNCGIQEGFVDLGPEQQAEMSVEWLRNAYKHAATFESQGLLKMQKSLLLIFQLWG